MINKLINFLDISNRIFGVLFIFVIVAGQFGLHWQITRFLPDAEAESTEEMPDTYAYDMTKDRCVPYVGEGALTRQQCISQGLAYNAKQARSKR